MSRLVGARLLSAIDECVENLVTRAWTVLVFRQERPPAVVGVCRVMSRYADVLVIRGSDSGVAYRAFLDGEECPYRAERVVWHFAGNAVDAMRAVFVIPPAVLDVEPYVIPPEFRLPDSQPVPLPGSVL